jgi:ABC-type multidrug transport system fused ATPase/permease subunit
MADASGAAAMIQDRASARGANAAPDPRLSVLYADEQRQLRPRDVWKLLRKSWPFIGAQRRLLAIKTALALTSLTFFLLVPWPLKIIIDNIINGRPLDGAPAIVLGPFVGDDRALLLAVVTGFLLIAAIMSGMTGDQPVALSTDVQSGGLDQAGITSNDANEGWSLWNGLFGYLETRVTIQLTQRINQAVRTAVYERFLRSPLGIYADQKIGDAVFRTMYDSASIGAVFYRGVLAPIMSVVMYVLVMVILAAQFPNEPVIPIAGLLVLPIVFFGSMLFGRVIRSQSQRMRERGSDVMAAFEERIAQVQLIKAMGQERRESAHIDRASWESFSATLRMIIILMGLFIALAPPIMLLTYYALYYLMVQVIEARMTLGDVVLLAIYGGMLARPMGILGSTWVSLQAPAAGLRRVQSVLENLNETPVESNGRQLDARISTLEFRDLAVGYAHSAPVLQHVTLTLRGGQLVALAGASGAGKTTLINTIPRFTEPLGGTVLIDGIDARTLAASALRDRIGFVFQQEALFSATIAENIRYGSPDASFDNIRRAAVRAGAAEFIEALPDGYQTMLGRRGAKISVGQKQWIAIARALLREPDMMILDEPMAPLDPGSEAALLATLREIARERIVLIVAHRANTLAACDQVFFLHDGTLAASGSHRELLATNPAYRGYLAVTESEIRG